MPRPTRRQVVIMLSGDEWRQLARQATEAERDPYQQARWLLLQKLRESRTPSEIDEEPERATSSVA
jgi:hypothetical protein